MVNQFPNANLTMFWSPHAASKQYLLVQKVFSVDSAGDGGVPPASEQVWVMLFLDFLCSEYYKILFLQGAGKKSAMLSFSKWMAVSHLLLVLFFILQMIVSLFLQIWKMGSVQLILPVGLQKQYLKIVFWGEKWEMTFEEIGVSQVSESHKCNCAKLSRCVLNTSRFEFIPWINSKILDFFEKEQFSLSARKSLVLFNVKNHNKTYSVVEHSFNLNLAE